MHKATRFIVNMCIVARNQYNYCIFSHKVPTMKQLHHYSTIVICLILLAGCTDNKEKDIDNHLSILPIIDTGKPHHLNDQQVTTAIQLYLKDNHAPVFSRYEFMRVDLNQDGSKDALVYLTAPYGQWCGTSGCTLLMLHAKRHGFIIAGEAPDIRTPLYISDTHTNNWRDIITYSSGNIDKAKYSAFKFNGTAYQFNDAALSYNPKRSYRIAFP